MGAREVIVAAVLMAMINRCMATVCDECHQEVFENGTVINYKEMDYRKWYCSTPTCNYGMYFEDCDCCGTCYKGPGESCAAGWFQCGKGLECRMPETADCGFATGICSAEPLQDDCEDKPPTFICNYYGELINTCLNSLNYTIVKESSTADSENHSDQQDSYFEDPTTIKTPTETTTQVDPVTEPSGPSKLSKSSPLLTTDDFPESSFTCTNKTLEKFYPDIDLNCKVIHFCVIRLNEREVLDLKFICPNGTIFSVVTKKCEIEGTAKCTS